MIVIVEAVDRVEGNIAVFRGRDRATGKPVLFGADANMCRDLLAEMLVEVREDGYVLQPVHALVEGWQVL